MIQPMLTTSACLQQPGQQWQSWDPALCLVRGGFTQHRNAHVKPLGEEAPTQLRAKKQAPIASTGSIHAPWPASSACMELASPGLDGDHTQAPRHTLLRSRSQEAKKDQDQAADARCTTMQVAARWPPPPRLASQPTTPRCCSCWVRVAKLLADLHPALSSRPSAPVEARAHFVVYYLPVSSRGSHLLFLKAR